MSYVSQVAHEPTGTQRGQPDDAGLIAESCRAPERFGVVFDRHAAAIHGYIARRLGRDAADDLVAETFQGAGFDELILDPETFAVMGQQATLGPAAGAKAGQIVGGVAILKSVLVSSPGIRP